MRDAFGGVTNLVIIVVFLVLVSGYLAFNVNYTKAFRVKNKIISVFEQYEGDCDRNEVVENTCNGEILAYMNGIGYSAPYFDLTKQGYTCRYGYCFKEVPINNATDTKQKSYFKIVTQISIDIPIINRILPGLRVFQVSGDTKPIVMSRGD